MASVARDLRNMASPLNFKAHGLTGFGYQSTLNGGTGSSGEHVNAVPRAGLLRNGRWG
jgi:hypothetical protein